MTQLEKLSVKIADEEQYNAVTEVLRSMGYKPNGNPIFSTWVRKYVTKNYHVLASEDCYAIHNHNGGDKYAHYTVDEFLSKHQNLTPPLTIGEIHQLRELLKAHSPRMESEVAKPETYEGVFLFDGDGANCNHRKKRFYWSEDEWLVVFEGETEPHTLIEAPHEVGEFYLLNIGNLKNDPTSYGLYDGSLFWHWTKTGCIISTATATNLKVVIA
jgi:hypothetical protein